MSEDCMDISFGITTINQVCAMTNASDSTAGHMGIGKRCSGT